MIIACKRLLSPISNPINIHLQIIRPLHSWYPKYRKHPQPVFVLLVMKLPCVPAHWSATSFTCTLPASLFELTRVVRYNERKDHIALQFQGCSSTSALSAFVGSQAQTSQLPAFALCRRQ